MNFIICLDFVVHSIFPLNTLFFWFVFYFCLSLSTICTLAFLIARNFLCSFITKKTKVFFLVSLCMIAANIVSLLFLGYIDEFEMICLIVSDSCILVIITYSWYKLSVTEFYTKSHKRVFKGLFLLLFLSLIFLLLVVFKFFYVVF